jgi:hypothetical protein
MLTERWGTLSVKDHIDTQTLVADLLLYDRLVFPALSRQNERVRWRQAHWDPDLQEQRIEQLGNLAIAVPWDEYREGQYRELCSLAKYVSLSAFTMTRMTLANERFEPPEGVDEVRAVAAYHELESGKTDLGILPDDPANQLPGQLAFVIGQKFLVPQIASGDPDDAILRAIELSQTPAYREQRADLYEWQEATVDAILRGRKTVESSMGEMQGLIEKLNSQIRHRWGLCAAKFVFTLVSAAVPFAIGKEELAPIAAIPGLFEIVKFFAFDFPELPANNKTQASAMILSVQKAFR